MTNLSTNGIDPRESEWFMVMWYRLIFLDPPQPRGQTGGRVMSIKLEVHIVKRYIIDSKLRLIS